MIALRVVLGSVGDILCGAGIALLFTSHNSLGLALGSLSIACNMSSIAIGRAS